MNYKQLKKGILQCINVINSKRAFDTRILGRKLDIVNIITIYKFYKKYRQITNIKSKSTTKTKPTTKIKSNMGQHMKPNTNKQTLSPKIYKDGFMFILIDGKYKKVTKKHYSLEEIEAWGTKTKKATKPIKQIKQKTVALPCKKNNKNKDAQIQQIYKKEFMKYPPHLQKMINGY